MTPEQIAAQRLRAWLDSKPAVPPAVRHDIAVLAAMAERIVMVERLR